MNKETFSTRHVAWTTHRYQRLTIDPEKPARSDRAGRTIALINGVGDTTQYGYDLAGRQIRIVNGRGCITTNVYDNDSRQIATVDPMSNRTTRVFDAGGRVTSTINENGKITTAVYDKVNRTLSVTNPLLQTHTYDYDDAGRQILRIDARGLRTTYSYDKVDRQTVRQYQDGTRVTQVYDAVGNRTLLHDHTGRYTVTYDNLNRPQETKEPNNKTITLTYDKVSQRSTMNVPNVGRVTYTHDPARQLTKLKNGHNEVTTLVYDDAGRKTESKLPNGTKTSFTYDAANQMKGVVNVNSTNNTLSYYNYQFDGAGDRTSLWDNGVDVSNWNYDFTGQLTNDVYRPATTALNWNGLTVDQWFLLSVSGWDNLLADHVPTGGAGLLAYSPTGNRLTQTDPVTGDVTTFTYDNGNRLLTAVDVSGITTYTYDANGNQLTIEEPSGDITTNTWDGENRLIQVEHPSGDVTTYAYNGDGLRVLQDDGVAETRFVYDGNNLVLELDDVGVVKADVTYLPAEYAQVLSQHRDLESSFYLCDGIHNVRQLTDDAQVVTDEYSFDGWGKLTSSTGSTANSQLYKGEYLAYRKDPDAGPELQYSTHHRNYNPQTGVFTAADPAKDDLNLYRYVKNNPVNEVDPSGLQESIEDGLAKAEIYARELHHAIPYLKHKDRIRKAATHRDRQAKHEADQVRHNLQLEATRLEAQREAFRQRDFNQLSVTARFEYMLIEGFNTGQLKDAVADEFEYLLKNLPTLVKWIGGTAAAGFAAGALGGTYGVAAFTVVMAGMGLAGSIGDILEFVSLYEAVEAAQSYADLEKHIPEFDKILAGLIANGALTIILSGTAKFAGKAGSKHQFDTDPNTARSGPNFGKRDTDSDKPSPGDAKWPNQEPPSTKSDVPGSVAPSSGFKPLVEGFDFGKHLRGLIGDPPSGMVNPHAHHILFKKGLGPAQKALVEEGQAILRKVGIDPIYGKENLVWAPFKISQQHGPEALKKVVDKLRELDRLGADYDDFVEALKRLGKEAAERGT